MRRYSYAGLIAFLLTACVSVPALTARDCTDLVMKTALRLDAGKMSFKDMADMRIGRSGFFYVLSAGGVIVFHPNQPLTGRNVGDVPQVKTVLAAESGVSTDTLGGLSRTVFFRRLESGHTLCLTVDTEELEGR